MEVSQGLKMNVIKKPNTKSNSSVIGKVEKDDNDADLEFDHTPYYKTITNAGRSHFNRITDALAEFIDNSIQATSKSHLEIKTKEIVIQLYLDGYIVISDNGEGMNHEDIKNFATYSFDQESRGNIPHAKDTSFISKFGVGAKEAGFYLGTSIRLITCKYSSSDGESKSIKSNQYVSEYVMDEKVYESRQLSNQQVYKGRILRRESGNLSHIIDKDELNVLQKIPNLNNGIHFTTIVIRLRDHIRDKLQQTRTQICSQLAEIYRFQLKPELLPNNIVLKEKFQTLHPSIRNEKLVPPRPIINAEPASTDIKPLRIFLTGHNKGGQIALEVDVGDSVRDDSENAASAFRFNLEFPDPTPQSQVPNKKPLLMQLHNELVSSYGGLRHCLTGVIFYYPFRDGAETRPKPAEDDDWITDTSIGLSSSSQSDRSIKSNKRCHDVYDESEGATFSVYWQNRLLPQSTVNSLHFFPTVSDSIDCMHMKIASRWRYRIKGYLFLDWKFNHVSNNKLKVTVDPNFDRWLNDPVRKESLIFVPKSHNFEVWLRMCHGLFDRERKLDMRDLELERLHESQASSSYVVGYSLFKRVTIEREAKSHSIEANNSNTNNIYLICNPSKHNKINSKMIYGKIVAFQTTAALPNDQGYYYGNILIRYVRYPSEIYGDTEIVESANEFLTLFETLDYNLSAIIASKKIMDSLMKARPAKLAIYCFPELGHLVKDKFNSKNFQSIEEGTTIRKIAVQVLDGEGKPIIGKPHSVKSELYTVTLLHKFVDSRGRKKELSEGADLWYYDSDTKDDIKYSKSKDLSQLFYSGFYQKKYNVGAHEITVTVFDKEREIMSETFTINVIPTQIHDFKITISPSTIQPVDCPLPSMFFSLLDKKGEVSKFTGELYLQIETPYMTVFCAEYEFVHAPIIIEEDDLGNFIVDEWMMKLKNPDVLLFDGKVFEKSVTFTLTMSSRRPDGKQDVIGKPFVFKLNLCPGFPFNILPVTPDDIEVDNKSEIPELKFHVYDGWGQRTIPVPGIKWDLDLGAGVCSTNQPVVVRSNGLIVFTNVFVKAESVPADGLLSTQEVILRYESKGFSPKIHLLNEKEPASATNPIVCTFGLKIVPNIGPPSDILLYHDSNLIETDVSAEIGSSLSLRYEIVDEKGFVFPMSDDLFNCKNGGVHVSWDRRNAAGRRSVEGLLPLFESSNDETECALEVSCVTKKYSVLTKVIKLYIVRGMPDRWLVFGNTPAQLLCGEMEIFLSTILNVSVVSKNEVTVNKIDSAAQAIPELIASWEDNSETVSYNIPLIPRDDDLNLAEYDISPAFVFPSWPRPGMQLRLLVRDLEATFTEDVIDLPVLAGLPRKVSVSCASLCIENPTESCSIVINRFSKISSLKFHYFDNCGNIAPSSHIAGAIKHNIRVENSSGACIFESTSKNNPLTISLDEILIACSGMASIPIQFSISYKYNDQSLTSATAIVNAEYVQLNIITDIIFLINSSAEPSFSFSVDEPIPTITIGFITENSKPYCPSLESVNLCLTTADDSRLDIWSYFQKPEGTSFILIPFPDAVLGVGAYTLSLKYYEQRPQFLANADDLAIVRKCSLYVCAGEAVAVIPFDQSTKHSLEKMIVSLSSTQSSKNRVLGSSLRFAIADVHENVSLIGENCNIVCYVKHISTKIDTYPPIRLVGADQNGVVHGIVDKSNSFVFFNSLEISSGTTPDANIYSLIFEFRSFKIIEKAFIKSYTAMFELLTDISVLNKVNLLKDAKIAKDELYLPLEIKRRGSESAVRELESIILSISSKIISKAPVQSQEKFGFNEEDLLSLEKDLVSQRQEMQSASLREAVKRPLNFSNILDIDYVGWVIDMGFVDDPKLAVILSVAASRYMDSLIVKTKDAATVLYRRGVKCWPLNLMNRFKTGPERRERNEYEKARGELPLPLLVDIQKKPFRGNPRHLVNLIQLPKDKEDLRDNVFFNIFGTALLFDDLESAVAYREFLVNRNSHPPDIYTEHGDRLPSNGLMDPGSKIDLSGRNLPYIFGQMAGVDNYNFRTVEQDLAYLKDMKAALREYKEHKLFLESTNATSSQLQQDLKEINAELAALIPETGETTISRKKRPRDF